MKKLLLILALAMPVAYQGCATPPAERVVVTQTLLSVGQAAEAAVTLSAQLYDERKITAAQAREVLDFYTQKFQPAFRVAKTAVNSDLSSLASPDILALGNQLFSLVVKLQTHP